MVHSKFVAAVAFTTALALARTPALGVSAASAADLGARPYTKAPAIVDVVFNWSGFYVGGHVQFLNLSIVA